MKKNIEIIYADDDIMVVNKPSGISVTADRSGKEDLPTVIQKQLRTGDENKLRLVHRLDKATSGVMLIAKNRETQSQFSSWFEKRAIKKTYLALVSGVVTKATGRINKPLAHSRQNAQLMQVDPRGKEAFTEYELLADFGAVSLLAVRPITGRTHQIRVHMASEALPLAIDPLYASTRPIMLSDFKANFHRSKTRPEKPLIDRLTLHAYQLQIPPAGDRQTTFIAKLDNKFAATIKMLTKHNPNGPDAFANHDQFQAIINAEPI